MSTDMLPLRGYQREAIDEVFKCHREGVRRPAVILPTGGGKSQPLDEPVLTPDGWKPIGSLSVGDRVIGSDGSPTRVIGVFPQGIRPTVTVRFSDATSVRCDTDHLWNVQTRTMKSLAKRGRSAAWTTLTATEIGLRPSHWYIPVVGAVQYAPTAQPLPLDPYTLGVLLGDGGLSVAGQVRLHTRHDLVPLLSLPDGHRVTLYRDQGVMGNYLIASGRGRSANRVMDALRDLGLHGHTAHGKFVPEAYLRASPDDRLQLLRGVLDTDGSASGSGVDYVTVSEALADGVAELVRSLGGRCTVSRKQTSWTHAGEKRQGVAYRAYITLPRGMCPFRTSRKADALRTGQQFDPVKRVDSVEPGPDLECVCISVDAPDQLYVTAGYAVTHNTVIFSHMASEYMAATGLRVLVLVHRDELADQAIAKIKAVAPHLSVGKVKAESDQVHTDVVVASVQTLSRPSRMARLLDRQRTFGVIGLVITDECHHALAPSYARIYAALPEAVHAGFTATMARGDGSGLGSVWEDIAFSRSLAYMIGKGHLVAPVGRSIAVDDLDVSRVKRSGGDYQAGDMGRALEDSGAVERVAQAYLEHAADRPGVVFWPTVATAQDGAKALEAVGIRSAVVSGETPRDERRQIFADRQAGRIQVLSNCMVLTEGFDDPGLSCAVIARPTSSQPLYVQMVGRVLRTFPGKTDALVLDVVGASEDNKLMTLIDLEPGLFQDPKPCRTCDQVPCTCPCPGCGGRRPCAECREPAPELVLAGSGKAIDLFTASRSAWLRTYKGVMFVPAGESDIILWPHMEGGGPDGTWDVAEVPKRGKWRLLHPALPLEAAMSWAEVEAEDRGESIALRGASWRRRKAAPTEPQLSTLFRLGLAAPETKAQASDLISVAFTSHRVDRYVAA